MPPTKREAFIEVHTVINGVDIKACGTFSKVRRLMDDIQDFSYYVHRIQTIKFQVNGKDTPMLKMKYNEKADCTLVLLDDNQQPAFPDGVPVWASTSPDVFSVVPSADGMSASVVGLKPGSGQINVTLDADMTEARREITGLEDVTILAGEVATVQLQTGNVTRQ